MKIKCGATGCKKELGGWIDFGLGGEDYQYARLRFCKEHFKVLMKKVEEEIKKERESGELEEGTDYAIVPPHITKKVINLKGVDWK